MAGLDPGSLACAGSRPRRPDGRPPCALPWLAPPRRGSSCRRSTRDLVVIDPRMRRPEARGQAARSGGRGLSRPQSWLLPTQSSKTWGIKWPVYTHIWVFGSVIAVWRRHWYFDWGIPAISRTREPVEYRRMASSNPVKSSERSNLCRRSDCKSGMLKYPRMA